MARKKLTEKQKKELSDQQMRIYLGGVDPNTLTADEIFRRLWPIGPTTTIPRTEDRRETMAKTKAASRARRPKKAKMTVESAT
jgi:hypothetical protein